MVAVALILLVSYEPPELEFIKFNPHVLITLTAAVIVGREITISALREWMAEMGARGKVAVSSVGKLKTIFQMTGLSMMLFRSDVWFIPAFELGVYCLVAAAALTLWSMIVYLRAGLAGADAIGQTLNSRCGAAIRGPGRAACDRRDLALTVSARP